MIYGLSRITATFATTLVLATSAFAQSADTVLYNAKIYTVNPEQPWAEAVAIRGTDIVYVGDSAGALELADDQTDAFDLEGLLMLPGLISGHEHPLMTASIAAALYLPYSEDKEKMLAAVKDHVERNPDGAKWSFGGSYEGRVDITREDIDAILPDEPFVMIAASGHGAWVNSAALEAVGVDKDTPDPIDKFEREADGTPTGYLSTSAAAMYMVIELGLIKKEDLLENLPRTIEMYNSYGFTAIQDAGQPPGSEEPIFGAAAELEEKGQLNMRISGSVMAQRAVHLEAAFENLAIYVPEHQSELFRVNTLKIHGGSPDGYSSPLLEPYSDRPDFSGNDIFEASVRNEATMKAAELGYAVHTHVMGDKAIREALDAFELVREAGFDEVRLSTGHSTMIHPDDQPRYAPLNVTVNTFAAQIAAPDDTNLSRVGSERMKYWQPMKSLVDQGARLAMSADAPTTPLSPWLGIEVAMLRKMPDQTESLYREEEALTLEQAIEAYTMGAAYQLEWENVIGSIEVGKRADLVIVDQDLFEIDPERIHDTNAVATFMNGQVVYRSDRSDQ